MSAGHNRELHGIAASPGVAVGVALVLDRRRMSIPRRHIEEAEVEREVQRLCFSSCGWEAPAGHYAAIGERARMLV